MRKSPKELDEMFRSIEKEVNPEYKEQPLLLKKHLQTNFPILMEMNNNRIFRFVFSHLIKEWYSARELSKIYDEGNGKKEDSKEWKDLKPDERKKGYTNNRHVIKYFNKLKSFNYLDSRIVVKPFRRISKNGKEHVYPSKLKRFRINIGNILYDYVIMRYDKILFKEEEHLTNLETVKNLLEYGKDFKKFLPFLTDDEKVRHVFANQYKEGMGIEDYMERILGIIFHIHHLIDKFKLEPSKLLQPFGKFDKKTSEMTMKDYLKCKEEALKIWNRIDKKYSFFKSFIFEDEEKFCNFTKTVFLWCMFAGVSHFTTLNAILGSASGLIEFMYEVSKNDYYLFTNLSEEAMEVKLKLKRLENKLGEKEYLKTFYLYG